MKWYVPFPLKIKHQENGFSGFILRIPASPNELSKERAGFVLVGFVVFSPQKRKFIFLQGIPTCKDGVIQKIWVINKPGYIAIKGKGKEKLVWVQTGTIFFGSGLAKDTDLLSMAMGYAKPWEDKSAIR
jgi:hypothetical protein